MPRQTVVRVEVIEAEVPLLQIFPLPIGLSQICGCSISSVLSLINWRGFKLQEQAASRLYQEASQLLRQLQQSWGQRALYLCRASSGITVDCLVLCRGRRDLTIGQRTGHQVG